jgi:hypothetical protein
MRAPAKTPWSVSEVVAITLVIVAVLSAGSIALSTRNYLEGISAASKVRLGLSDLELRDEDGSEVLVTFHLENGSPIDVQLEFFYLRLYLNDNFMASQYYPSADRLSLAGFEEMTVDFVVPLRPFYLQYIEQARQREDFSWLVRGEVRLLLSPFHESEVWLGIEEHWSGR